MKKLKEKLEKTKELITNSEDISIFTHNDPDGDALGSISALNLALKKLNKEARAYISGEISPNFYFLPIPRFENNSPPRGGLFLVLDCADLKRTGFEEEISNLKDESTIINIDHHPQEEEFGYLNIVYPSFTSTSELIFYLLETLGIEIDKDLADCLLTGIFTDTGSFMHPNTTENSLVIASRLVSKGANIKEIADYAFRRKNISTLRLWGRVLLRIKNDRQKGIVTSIITKKDLEDCGATKADLEGVVNLINAVPDAKAALLLTQDENQIKGSLRSENGGLDVRRIARLFGGGGHIRASGFKIKGKLHETSEGWEIIEE